MKRAIEFLNGNREVSFATVEGDKPKIRVFQIMDVKGEDLYFATAPHKEVYAQLQANANVEILAAKGDISVRVTSVAQFDVDDEQCRHIFETNPVLPRLYPSYDSMVYFRLPIVKLDYFDLSYTPPLFEHYEK